MRIARLNAWPLGDVIGLDGAYLALAEDEAREAAWPPATELLALIFEQLSALYCAFLAANTKKGTTVPKPVRVPRPDWVAQAPAADTERASSFAEFFLRLKAQGQVE